MDELKSKIQNLMETYGITYKELAEEIGIPTSTLHNYIKSRDGKIPISFVEKVAPALHTTPEYLLGIGLSEEGDSEEVRLRKMIYTITDGMDVDDLNLLVSIIDRLLS